MAPSAPRGAQRRAPQPDAVDGLADRRQELSEALEKPAADVVAGAGQLWKSVRAVGGRLDEMTEQFSGTDPL